MVLYPLFWGWAGVNLFFVLSGFLITSSSLKSRDKPHYFRNFYARRALRIWPVYVLVLVVCYLNAPWFIGLPVLDAFRTAPWWAYILFLQNLFHLALPPAIGPTWSLAIEEQYYFLWAPVVRILRAAVDARRSARQPHSSLRRSSASLTSHWITPTHTLTHLDGIAMGSLSLSASTRCRLAAAHGSPRPRRHVRRLHAAATIAGGTAFLDSALDHRFRRSGARRHRLHRRAQSGERDSAPRPARLLRPHQLRPLHDPHLVFIYFGWFDLHEWIPTASPAISPSSPSASSPCHARCHRPLVRIRVAESSSLKRYF